MNRRSAFALALLLPWRRDGEAAVVEEAEQASFDAITLEAHIPPAKLYYNGFPVYKSIYVPTGRQVILDAGLYFKEGAAYVSPVDYETLLKDIAENRRFAG